MAHVLEERRMFIFPLRADVFFLIRKAKLWKTNLPSG